MRTFILMLIDNPVNTYWDEIIPERRIGKEFLGQIRYIQPYIKVPESELAVTLYNLVNSGSSFSIYKTE